MNPVDLQFWGAFLTFVTAVITLVVVIIDAYRRQLKRQPGDGTPTNGELPLHPQQGPSATRPKEMLPTTETNNESHAEYEVGYRANNGEEQPLQHKQQGW